MRINVYSQELTKEVTIVSKDTTGLDGEPTTYYGVRMFLASPDILHHTEEDDDRSAITFWVPHAHSFNPSDLAKVFEEMGRLAHDIGYAEGLQQPDRRDDLEFVRVQTRSRPRQQQAAQI